MRLVFAGTPRFAAIALDGLLDAGHDVALVLTQPHRQAGRGLKTVGSEVWQVAASRGLSITQPETLKSPEALATLESAHATAMVVVAYGLLLPQAVLDLFPYGCLNVHASLLPRWRGAAPIQRALLAGDNESGVCIMRMDSGLDTGPVYRRQSVPITAVDTAGTLHDHLAQVGIHALLEVLRSLEEGAISPLDQAPEGVSYAHKVQREDAALHWAEPAVVLDRVIRAFNPVPGAHVRLGSERVKIWGAKASETGAAGVGEPGVVVDARETGVTVACGQGTRLTIQELQREGGRRLTAADFLRGHPLAPGDRFGDGV